jgi:tripartite ATP-independent transporter DctM subunit
MLNAGNKRSLGERSLSTLTVIFLTALMCIPLLESVGRKITGTGITGAAAWCQHLTLWIGLCGALLATSSNKHIAIATQMILNLKKSGKILARSTGIIVAFVVFLLALSSAQLVYYQTESPEMIGGWFPVWLAQLAMPVAFLVMGAVTILRSHQRWTIRVLVALGVLGAAVGFVFVPGRMREFLIIPMIITLVLLAFAGMPLFAALGGVSLTLLHSASIPLAALAAETYRTLTHPVLPSIPLFALAGTILASGGAPERLVRVVRAWTSWLPGGVAISTICVSALFTAVTGASGVTILALGGMLLPVLIASDYRQKFSMGLLTASGSVGLLFPPSLPVILYGVYGHVPIDKMFMGGLLPGVLLILLLAVFSIYQERVRAVSRQSFDMREALRASWAAKGDLLLPALVVFGLFGGIFTLVETAAFVAIWAILLETIIHKKIRIRKALPKTFVESCNLTGALLIVMGVASGLVSYIVDEQIPLKAIDLVQSAIQSKWVFLIILNLVLLLIGALMDIYTAIVVVVPLIGPLGVAYGIDPVQLGIIFLANLELGYLTPPVGMNLFFSSLRFKKPLLGIWKTVIPFLLVFAIWVLLITYLPFITVDVASWLSR